MQTVNNILKNAKNLKGSGISVSKDLGKEDREAKNILLLLRKRILEKDSSQKIRVYGNQIIINDIKLTLTKTAFDNKHKKIDGKSYIFDRFSIDVGDIGINSL